MNSLLFVLRKIQRDKIKHNKDCYVFTGSSVGVVPILSKFIYYLPDLHMGKQYMNITNQDIPNLLSFSFLTLKSY